MWNHEIWTGDDWASVDYRLILDGDTLQAEVLRVYLCPGVHSTEVIDFFYDDWRNGKVRFSI